MIQLPLSPTNKPTQRRFSTYQVVSFVLLLLCSIYFTFTLAHIILVRPPKLFGTVVYQSTLDVQNSQNSQAQVAASVDDILKASKTGADGNFYPPSHLPKVANKALKMKAGFIVLVRNRELNQMKNSMKQVEKRFNHKFEYPWIFLNDEPFTELFVKEVSSMTNSEVRFGLVPKEHWSIPDWISKEKAAETRKKNAHTYIYGASESYRHMCRFQSGFFFQHPLTLDLDYYWRVEPGIEIRCNIDYDPFAFMAINNKTYGFTIAAHETRDTVTTLYQTTKDFIALHPDYVNKRAGLHFLTDASDTPDISKVAESEWNMCHFWSNFEIADLRFWRSKEYMEYFNYLDKAGGFFYERWGDAPIHSLAAALFLDKAKLHHFDDIGYSHKPWDHCPRNQAYHKGRCDCDPSSSFDYNSYSCLKKWWAGADEKEPAGYVVPRSLPVGKGRPSYNPLL
ncbi:hypothetical protein CBS101457_006067 [Exobasidium rhododendri]|nr:hypothetical protein CBS101457_006067 [Exobasidium rhododendri]